jgi:uncharacterized protein DUF3485
MTRFVPALTALAIIVLSGFVHGIWTNRWTVSHEVESAVKRLETVPSSLGDWTSQSLKVDQKALEIGSIDGYLSRLYTNRRDGREITILLVCGRPGPISVHTPDYCFAGIGYRALSSPVDQKIPLERATAPVEFRTAKFRKESAGSSSTLRIYWSWSADGVWKAPENPRLHFAPYRALYKLYVIRELGSTNEQAEDDTCQSFMGMFLPELDRDLFPKPAHDQRVPAP